MRGLLFALLFCMTSLGNAQALVRFPSLDGLPATKLDGYPPSAPGEGQRFPSADWTRGDPAAMGWSVNGLAQVRTYADRIGASSVMIVQHGVVVDQWGDTQVKTPLFSARKSLMSALVGIAVARHQIDLDATLAQLGMDDNAPSLTPTEKQATVRELLEARSGIYHASVYETPAMLKDKPPRGSHAPGMFWSYNNWDFNAVGAIYEKATGERIFDAFARDIAQPIGMQDYQPDDGRYVSGEPATRYRAYPIDMSARDLARFAWLFLNEGRWNGRQVVPAEWVRESTRPISNTNEGDGYAYMWWTSAPASGAPRSDASAPDAFWAYGHLGQYAMVVPALDLVVVARVDPQLTDKHFGEHGRARLLALVEAAGSRQSCWPVPALPQGT